MSTANAPELLTPSRRQKTEAKFKKLHAILKASDALDMDDIQAATVALMDHLRLSFVDYDTYVDDIISEMIAERGRPILNENDAEDFRVWCRISNPELTAMDKFTEMEDYFFDLINTKLYQSWHPFLLACERYLITLD